MTELSICGEVFYRKVSQTHGYVKDAPAHRVAVGCEWIWQTAYDEDIYYVDLI